ncbi:MAG: cell division protein ZapA [Proteobacteria bacterium]|jgi:cell division protein ZapA|nr:cell division protein ZapA [Pseudomonadota bacterium]GBF29862.1 cell division protein ZapA [bacterium MnTg03]
MSDALPISVSILDKDYKISCPTGEQPALLASAKYLDGKMREVRDNGNMMGTERVAVIAALNITNDFLSSNQVQQELGKELPPRLKNLEEKITQALEHARQLEI